MTTIVLDIAAFRVAIPQYADETTYPDSIITNRWAEATCYISDSSYGRLSITCRTLAIQYMTAHLINLSDLIDSGAAPGQVVSAGEDGVSVSLTPPPNRNQWQWWLGLTPWGQRLNSLLANAYVGGLYIGGSRERTGFRKIGSRF